MELPLKCFFFFHFISISNYAGLTKLFLSWRLNSTTNTCRHVLLYQLPLTGINDRNVFICNPPFRQTIYVNKKDVQAARNVKGSNDPSLCRVSHQKVLNLQNTIEVAYELKCIQDATKQHSSFYFIVNKYSGKNKVSKIFITQKASISVQKLK